MSLKNLIVCGGKKVDILVKRAGEKISVSVKDDGPFSRGFIVRNGETIDIKIK
jgi:signal transduction histidine kinase